MIRLGAGSVTRALFATAIAAALAVASWRYFVAPDRSVVAAAEPTTSGGALPTIRRADKPRAVPELHFIDGAGAARSFSEFRGRVVLLNIWATWCVPCRTEMPALDRLQSMLGGSAFEVVALSLDRGGMAAVRPFFEELHLKSLRVYVATDDDVIPKLQAVGVPLTMLVDRQGRELWRRLGPAEWDQPALVQMIRKEIGEETK